MHCPACKTTTLEIVPLDTALNAHHCMSCHGQWISGEHYWDWLRGKGDGETASSASVEAAPAPAVHDTPSAKLCPSCARLLIRYRVGHGLGFTIEHCPGCDGVWLDESEWEALKARNLHDDLQLICDSLWQGQVFKDEQRQLAEARLARMLGADFERAKEVRAWIAGHPNRSALLAYLAGHLRVQE
jgi:Zn-finger nucleic acid-binding protein